MALRAIDGRDPELLAELYLKLKRQGLVGQIFHEGGGGLLVWLQWLFERSPITLAAVDESGEPLGAAWLNGVLSGPPLRRAEISCAFARGVPPWEVVRVAKAMLDKISADLAPCLLLATIPEPNRQAATLARRLGFRHEASIRDYFTWRGEPCRALIFSRRVHLQTSGDEPGSL